MEVWLSVENKYNSFLLFSENHDCGWIYSWFNKNIDGMNSKLKDNAEIKIEYNTINDFFHMCLDVVVDVEDYVGKNPALIVPEDIAPPSTLYSIQLSAHRILNRVLEHGNDCLSSAEYYLGVEF